MKPITFPMPLVGFGSRSSGGRARAVVLVVITGDRGQPATLEPELEHRVREPRPPVLVDHVGVSHEALERLYHQGAESNYAKPRTKNMQICMLSACRPSRKQER